MPEDSRSGDAAGGLLMAGKNLRAFFFYGGLKMGKKDAVKIRAEEKSTDSE